MRMFLDFAGSGVVHMAGATAALVGVLLLGARKGKYGPNGQVNAIPGANLPLATLGTFLLWFGCQCVRLFCGVWPRFSILAHHFPRGLIMTQDAIDHRIY